MPDTTIAAPLIGLTGPVRVGQAPFGVDVRAIVYALKRQGGSAVYVARDERQARAATRLAEFFWPGLPTFLIPGWDCLPFDRTSPSPEAASARCNGLAALTAAHDDPETARFFATTGSSMAQRVAPLEAWTKTSLHLERSSRISNARLTEYLTINGYNRVSTVHERGDFAIRGGIVDIYPPTEAEPVRLDFFGDALEGLRSFDPETQRTTNELVRISLAPVSEVFFDEASLSTFRANYLEVFGAPEADALYEAARAGIKRQGLEQWLPLFHQSMVPLPDLAPLKTLWAFSPLARESVMERIAQARDYHEARMQAGSDSSVRVLPLDYLYLSETEFEGAFERRPTVSFSAFDDASGVTLEGKSGRSFAPERQTEDANVFEAVVQHLRRERDTGQTVIIAGWTDGSSSRLSSVLADHGLENVGRVYTFDAAEKAGIAIAELPVEAGFRAPGLTVVGEQDILGDRLAAPRRKRKAANYIAEVSALNPGDLVVHVDHGVARYVGLKTLSVAEAPHDCLELEYSGGDKLFLPVENIELIGRYGSEGTDAAVDKLGGTSWQTGKARAKKRILEMAAELIAIAAARALKPVESIVAPGGVYEEFSARFPYEETDDQLNAIEDVIGDLSSGRPMDRLVCGDVGFGKTEVALRAAFITAMTGRQVAVIAPTTLLARQHFNNFADRFRGWPVNVRQLSRLVSAKDAAKTREMLRTGECDVVIGTHALLAEAIDFHDLGLLIVDEEQRFGVKHKERLKELRTDVHVLTLSATPIPRTLQLALTGIRDLSIIATPPVDRLSVRTYVTEFDAVTLREALLREKYRGGQAFFVAPRVADLEKLEQFMRDTVPEVSLVVAHGQMGAVELEDIMTAFYEGKFDVLLSTTIVESGLDIPRANTLIIYRADMFGLAQLYQLRGRVGRSKLRAYAYFTTPRERVLTDGAEKRLKVLQSLDSLGAGFMLASHDLDMRGGGNLLGDDQSGHVKEVGVELYQSMLEDAVKALQSGGKDMANSDWSPGINVGAAVLIPEAYVEDLGLRLSLYRRLASVESGTERESFAAELIDRFGPIPTETQQLLEVTAIKTRCKALGIGKVDAGPKGATFAFRDDTPVDPARLMELVAEHATRLRLRPDGKLVFTGTLDSAQQRISAVKTVIGLIEKILQSPAGAIA